MKDTVRSVTEFLISILSRGRNKGGRGRGKGSRGETVPKSRESQSRSSEQIHSGSRRGEERVKTTSVEGRKNSLKSKVDQRPVRDTVR